MSGIRATEILLGVIWLVITFCLTRFLLPNFLDFLRRSGAVRANWQGRKIPGTAGVIFPVVLSLAIGLETILAGNTAFGRGLLLAIFGTAFFGLLDDLLGNTKQKGLRGHFRYFFREKKISTGFLKAGGISLLALIVALQRGSLTWAVLGDWLLLVLMVNFINLLDLRPGRALKVVIGLSFAGALAGSAEPILVGSTLGMSLAYLPYDLVGLAMLGDTGSNSLGMLTGLIFLSAPWGLKLFLLLILLIMHLLAEQYSFTRLITASRWLAALDNWGRAKGQGEGDSLLFVERISKR